MQKGNQLVVKLCNDHDISENCQALNTDEQFQAKKFNCHLCSKDKERQHQEYFLKDNIIPCFYQQRQQNLEAINLICKQLLEGKQNVNDMIDQLIYSGKKLTEDMKNEEQKLMKLFQSINPSIEEIQKHHYNYQCNFEKFQSNVEKRLIACSNYIKQFQIDIGHIEFEKLELIQEFPKEVYHYKLLNQSTIKQKRPCYTITFNFDDSILASGCNDKIVFSHFIDKQLTYHSQVKIDGKIKYLKFIAKENNYLLALVENEGIFFLKQTSEGEFVIQHKKYKPFNNITCADYTQQWFAVGFSNGEICFLKSDQDFWHQLFRTENMGQINSVSFNEACNKLISGGENNKVLIFQNCGREYKWEISQQINVESNVLRVKFFNNHQFMLYEPTINQLSIYKINGSQFEEEFKKKVQGNGKDSSYYPISESRKGFVFKHSNYLSFLKQSPLQKAFVLSQQSYFETEEVQGCLSNSEEYLIILDLRTEEYQVRQWMKLID